MSNMLTESDIRKMRVTDLKEELRERGLSTGGLKAVLVTRLLDAVANDVLLNEVDLDGVDVDDTVVVEDEVDELLRDDYDVEEERHSMNDFDDFEEGKTEAEVEAEANSTQRNEVESSTQEQEQDEGEESSPKKTNSDMASENYRKKISEELNATLKRPARMARFGQGMELTMQEKIAQRRAKYGTGTGKGKDSKGDFSLRSLMDKENPSNNLSQDMIDKRREKFGDEMIHLSMLKAKAVGNKRKFVDVEAEMAMSVRKERFGVTTAEEKMKQRQARFGTGSGDIIAATNNNNNNNQRRNKEGLLDMSLDELERMHRGRNRGRARGRGRSRGRGRGRGRGNRGRGRGRGRNYDEVEDGKAWRERRNALRDKRERSRSRRGRNRNRNRNRNGHEVRGSSGSSTSHYSNNRDRGDIDRDEFVAQENGISRDFDDDYDSREMRKLARQRRFKN